MQSKSSSKNNRGFTLVEIIVVVGIMAILSGIVYASLSGSKAQNRDQKRVADISNIQLALEMYFNINRQYPAKLWPDKTDPPGTFTYLSSATNILSNDVNPPTSDPSDKYHYVPLGGSKCSSYHLWATLETKSSALDSKKGYDSTGASICENSGTDVTSYYVGDEVNAASSSLVYDVTP
jgi:prepilin-type N-terminal cleavage/methylation domain-containing protein